MGLGGFLLASLGAFIRWMFSGFKSDYKYYFEGKEEDDIYRGFTQEIFNKIIGLVTIIAIIFFFGYLIKLGR